MHAEQVSEELRKLPKVRYAFQLEVGAGGKAHYQLFVSNGSAKNLKQWKAAMPGAHIEKIKGNVEQNIAYVTKTATRATAAMAIEMGYEACDIGPHVFNLDVATAKPVLAKRITEPWPWQESLTNLLAGPKDTRNIIWVWEEEGNVGKTSFCYDLALDGKAIVFGGKAGDVFSAVADWVDPLDAKGNRTGKGQALDVVVMDVPRCTKDYISYQSLEKLKDGLFFNAKYKSRMVQMASIHVVVMSNQAPDRTQMSADRWHVYKIKDKALVPDTPAAAGHHALFF
jgi:hypothetical protein